MTPAKTSAFTPTLTRVPRLENSLHPLQPLQTLIANVANGA